MNQRLNSITTALQMLQESDTCNLTLTECLTPDEVQRELLFGEGIVLNNDLLHVYQQGFLTPIENGIKQPNFDLHPDDNTLSTNNPLVSLQTSPRLS